MPRSPPAIRRAKAYTDRASSTESTKLWSDNAPAGSGFYLGAEAVKQNHLNQSVLVELGGHSSAPDMPPFGQFSSGLDVN